MFQPFFFLLYLLQASTSCWKCMTLYVADFSKIKRSVAIWTLMLAISCYLEREKFIFYAQFNVYNCMRSLILVFLFHQALFFFVLISILDSWKHRVTSFPRLKIFKDCISTGRLGPDDIGETMTFVIYGDSWKQMKLCRACTQ